jgi:formiminotetrahydrofolate cyclodeaminase
VRRNAANSDCRPEAEANRRCRAPTTKYSLAASVPIRVANVELVESEEVSTGLANRALVDVLNDFAAGKPVPGSGSANALVAAVAACLAASVAVKTQVSSDLKYINVTQTAADVERRSRFLAAELVKLLEDDSRVFAKVVAIRRDTGRQVDRILQDDAMRREIAATKTATTIPISIANRALEVGRLSVVMLDTGFIPARGESYAALIQSIAAIDGSLFVARLNLRTMRAKASKLNDPLLELPWIESRLRDIGQIRESMMELRVREQLARKESEVEPLMATPGRKRSSK